MGRIVLFNKPCQVLSQFSASENKRTLADYIDIPGVYAAGRLDYESEGLMILTDDGKLQAKISNPKYKQPKTYLVQVEGLPDDAATQKLASGVDLKDGRSRAASIKVINEPDWLWQRTPPIRNRKHIPTQWLEVQISEGKNRQIRRMTAAVGHPTLRLVRIQIAGWQIENLAPGEFRLIS